MQHGPRDDAAVVVMAADRVGAEVVEYLASIDENVSHVVLDSDDRGGCNKRIEVAAQGLRDARVLRWHEIRLDSALKWLDQRRIGLGVLAWWPRIVKEPLLGMPERGWVNFHPSYLPYNRGKNPNFWCLVDETPCGATLHLIDARVDTGPILARERIEVSWEDTGGTVHARTRELIVDMFKRHYTDIRDGVIQPQPQPDSPGSDHHSSELEPASRFDLDAPTTARRLLNLIRGRTFPAHPTASFEDGGARYGVTVIITKLEE